MTFNAKKTANLLKFLRPGDAAPSDGLLVALFLDSTGLRGGSISIE